MKFASLRPFLAVWALRSAWGLAIAFWAVALVPWFGPRDPAAAEAGAAVAVVATRPAAAAPVERPEPVYAPQRRREVPAANESSLPQIEPAHPEPAVCGLIGESPVSAEPTQAQRAAYIARQAELGLQLAFDALRSRSESQAQAAAWWLRVLLTREGGGVPPAAVDTLAQLALVSNDAWQLQLAARACDALTPAPAVCAGLSTRRWTTLQPDNAAAWLEQSSRDAASIDEALFRASRAPAFDSQRGRLAAWVLRAMPEQLPAMQRYAAWQRVDELERAADARIMAAAARHCNDAARRDANRAQLCDAVARWLGSETRAAGAQPAMAASAYALDCTSIERQWREARDAAQRGARVAAQGTAVTQRP